MQEIQTNFSDWLKAHPHRVYRFWVHKKSYTPYEQEQKFIDESRYESEEADFATIVEAVRLSDEDWLLGFNMFYDDDEHGLYVEYYRLSEIHLAFSQRDQDQEEEW